MRSSLVLLAAVLSIAVAVLGWMQYCIVFHGRLDLTRNSLLSLAFSVCAALLGWLRLVFMKPR